MLELEHIPPLRGERPAGTRVVKRTAAKQPAHAGAERRTVLRGAIVGVTALGFSALGVFPAARRAYAEGYDIYDACPSYAASHNCSPGCGPSAVEYSACTSGGWHRNEYAGNYTWYTLRPNECTVLAPWADGWNWHYDGSCFGCLWIKYRCHDGWVTSCPEQCWSYKTICRWIIQCGSV